MKRHSKIGRIKRRIKLPALGYSPAQATAAGAGPHDKPKKKKRRHERRKTKQELRKDYE